MKIFLATTSKLKSDILNTVGINHFLVENTYEENSKEKDIYKYVMELSLGKTMSVKDKVDGIIIGLDTVVNVDGKILEKPKSLEEARSMIKMCSNKETSVVTGLTMIYNHEIINEYCETKIKLREINDKDIEYYLNNEPDALHVSGFVIETIISNFIEYINGSYYNILGVPVETIYKHINDWEYNLIDLEK